MNLQRKFLLPALFIFLGSAILATAAEPKVRNFTQAAISPDGKRVAWIGPADSPSAQEASANGLYVQDLDKPGASPLRINTGDFAKAATEGVAWSADNRMLTFLCEAALEQSQVCVASTDGK